MPYALYCLASAHLAIDEEDLALQAWKQLTEDHVGSDWAVCAAQRLARLHIAKRRWRQGSAALEVFLELYLRNGVGSVDSPPTGETLSAMLECRNYLEPGMDAGRLALELITKHEGTWLARAAEYHIDRRLLAPGRNLLRNGGFELDVRIVRVPAGWTCVGTDPDKNDDWDGNLDRNTVGKFAAPRTGRFCVGKYTEWGRHRGWLLQTVPASASRPYECTVYGWTKISDGGPGKVRLGVDSSGGRDPQAPSVMWTEYASPVAGYESIGFAGEAAVMAESDKLTVFLELRQDESGPPNTMLFDDAVVRQRQRLPE